MRAVDRPDVTTTMSPSRWALFLKRVVDVGVSAGGLVLLAPLWAAIAAVVARTMGRPILFRQSRIGRGERPFIMLKFRTMTDERDADGNLLSDGARLTRTGAFLRRTSLDELPELVNVLKGDMSLVGPRPLLLRYGPFFTERERVRHSVRSGITGLAQINGRNQASWDDRLENDIRYVRSMSPQLDAVIVFRTLSLVLRRLGVEVDPGAVMLDLDAERSDRPLS